MRILKQVSTKFKLHNELIQSFCIDFENINNFLKLK